MIGINHSTVLHHGDKLFSHGNGTIWYFFSNRHNELRYYAYHVKDIPEPVSFKTRREAIKYITGE